MSEWYNEYNSSFMLSVAGLVFGSISACFMYMFKSKCNRIKLCGVIDIERDVEAEIEDTVQIPLPETTIPPVVESIRRRSYNEKPSVEAIHKLEAGSLGSVETR